MELADVYSRAEAALRQAQGRVVSEFVTEQNNAYIRSRGTDPGVWETAEAIGIVAWQTDQLDLLTSALQWVVSKQNDDGGFAAWPDISSYESYVECSTRVLISLAGACEALGKPLAFLDPIQATYKWILGQQNHPDGGWGSRWGYPSRMFPTAFAMQALRFAERLVPSDLAVLGRDATRRAQSWLAKSINPDGGYGTVPGVPSNLCSTGQAAWALNRTFLVVPDEVTSYIEGKVELSDLEDMSDPVLGEERRESGRYDLLMLAEPWACVGLLASHCDLGDSRLLRILDVMLSDSIDGIWYAPDDRYIWSTYFYVFALRLWANLYRAYTHVSVVDFSNLTRRSA